MIYDIVIYISFISFISFIYYNYYIFFISYIIFISFSYFIIYILKRNVIWYKYNSRKVIGDFSINFHGKFTEGIFDFWCIIFYIKIIDDSGDMYKKFIRNILFEVCPHGSDSYE